MYSHHVTLSTLSLISLFKTVTCFSKPQYSLFVLKVPLNPSQSVGDEQYRVQISSAFADEDLRPQRY